MTYLYFITYNIFFHPAIYKSSALAQERPQELKAGDLENAHRDPIGCGPVTVPMFSLLSL